MDPQIVSATAAVVSAGTTVILAMITFAYVRLTGRIARESAASRRGAIYLQVEKMMADVAPRRHRLYALPRDMSLWTDGDRALANEVSIVYQRISYLWVLGLLEKDLVGEGWGKTFIDTWDVIEPWVEQYRRETRAPNQRAHFESLVRELRKDETLMSTIYYAGDLQSAEEGLRRGI